MRSRSSATRRRASSSRVRSARSARSRMASTNARRLRTASPAAAAMPVQAKTPRFCWVYHGAEPKDMAAAVRTAIVARPTRHVVGRSVREATVYRATTVLIATGACGSPAAKSETAAAPVQTRTRTGARRRATSAAAPTTMSTTLRGRGVRALKVGPVPSPCGSTKDPRTIAPSTAAASTASQASGCARSQSRQRVRAFPWAGTPRG
ncbi:hypothetical protein BG846_00503 [Streptomyces fradiae ATCC 10745 = DSM 40063]|uniref:Uncharacterized protein n=1 Tax=Streptomyces fradiae ATCC 10745 = DSM 40063 TaxID=1319510 RepID=A0A1Y2P1X2_STRFR|nr:hypothetical protein BG846_00503 [Streptomyces fradiae ATCC 10745 = DSM 40063]